MEIALEILNDLIKSTPNDSKVAYVLLFLLKRVEEIKAKQE